MQLVANEFYMCTLILSWFILLILHHDCILHKITSIDLIGGVADHYKHFQRNIFCYFSKTTVYACRHLALLSICFCYSYIFQKRNCFHWL